MNEANPFVDTLDEGPKSGKLPGSINVLTILTFVGVGIGLLSAMSNFFMAETNYANTEKMITNDDAPSILKGMFTPEMLEMQRLMMENKVALLVITLVSLGLCLYGALQMRKLLKQGFYIWLMGEVLPIVATALFISSAAFKGWGLIGLAVPVVFIILYATQLKYMK